MISCARRRQLSREWRDRHRAKGECTTCGDPAFILAGRIYAKCRRCLLKGAWHQAEYRKRKKRAQTLKSLRKTA